MIIVCDFDGTLCRNKWPEIGDANEALISQLKEARENGDKVILNTYRQGERLEEAINWCREQGLEFDHVNENAPELIEKFGGDCRKITGDVFLDDRAIPFTFGERIELRSEEDRKMDEKRSTGRDMRQLRSVCTQFETREDDGAPHISGYFAVFGSDYEIGPGMSESVAMGAFSRTLGGDIRALTNHDTTLVLGRNTAGTLELREDSHGLWGDIRINPNDSDAMNTYERVKRGDVNQCSFGFDIIDEETEFRDDGSVHWTIREVELYEVSVCTFPAYKETSIAAREAQRDQLTQERLESWKEARKAKLRRQTADQDKNKEDN